MAVATHNQALQLNEIMATHARNVVATLRDRKAAVQLDNPPGRAFANAGLLEIYLKPTEGTKVSQVMNLENDVALAVRQINTRIVQGASNLIVQIPHGERARVTIESLLNSHRAPFNAIVGRDLYGSPEFVDLRDANTPHVLIAGTTGSGKTALAQSMLMSLVAGHTPNELRLVVIDPKNERAHWFEPRVKSHLVTPIARTPDAARTELQNICAYMEKVSQPVSQLVIYVDEMADLVMTGGDDVMQSLTRIAQRGRSAGVHLIGCTQKPNAKQLGPLLTANFPLRLVGRVVNGSDSNLACGQPGCGAEKLLGHGDFLRVEGARITRIQAAMPAAYGTPDPNARNVAPDWHAPQPAPTPAPQVSAPRTAPTPQPAPATAAEPEPMPDDDLLTAQARIVFWYRRAHPDRTEFGKTELARAIWPGLGQLAGGFSRRLPRIIARADEMTE